jgi:dipeptidyl aminopeptidase/acylaminoacyl peptidase
MKFASRFLLILAPSLGLAQGTAADYQRAQEARQKYEGLAVNVAGPVTWMDANRFWYRKSVKGGNEFVLVNAALKSKAPAFDHEMLAASLSKATGEKYTAITLPFTTIEFGDNGGSIQVAAAGSEWKCQLSAYACTNAGPVRATSGRGGQAPDAGPDPWDTNDLEFQNDVVDGMVVSSPQYENPQQTANGATARPATAPNDRNRTQTQESTKISPDGKSEAFIQNFNLFVRAKGAGEVVALSFDGSEGNRYTFQSISWSPDSQNLAAYRVRPGYVREVHYVESSPADQVQPKHSSRVYAKPGDTVDIAQPVLFHVAERKAVQIDNSLFPNPYSLSRPVWWKDSRGFTFDYNQRGHQLYRVIEVNAKDGAVRVLLAEESKTFVDYRGLVPNPRDTGKIYRHDIADGQEIIWASERDGWEHLYLYDGRTSKLKNQITKGNWVVRAIENVDDSKRQIWFQGSGMYPGKDPYFVDHYRINFDGSGLVALTNADGDHDVRFSPDQKLYVDTWSRIDQAPVSQLRRTEDQTVVMELERGDISALQAAGWQAPEAFWAMGRDGKTDIWGVIFKPSNFDPSKKYPVLENIYAGPQGSFVPKTFLGAGQPLAELGFIVVQIDGMGTNNRSKAFHDVAWKNLKDAGFEDRILWHKAVAAKYPWYDITRVGIYGTSAGGQNSLGALLFHPEFYKVAVSNSGCHDNRMDKIWWNEQWMGWPVGPQYAESSNVENAYRLQGKVLLVMGEMDTNVDPSSTLQVVNAFIKASKKFDLLYVPGGGHGAGGAYGQRLLQDFFVHNLLQVEPPEWGR